MDKKNLIKGILFLLIAFSFIINGILLIITAETAGWGYTIVGILFALIGVITFTQE